MRPNGRFSFTITSVIGTHTEWVVLLERDGHKGRDDIKIIGVTNNIPDDLANIGGVPPERVFANALHDAEMELHVRLQSELENEHREAAALTVEGFRKAAAGAAECERICTDPVSPEESKGASKRAAKLWALIDHPACKYTFNDDGWVAMRYATPKQLELWNQLLPRVPFGHQPNPDYVLASDGKAGEQPKFIYDGKTQLF